MIQASRSPNGGPYAAETRLIATPAAAGAARRFITDTLLDWNADQAVDDAVLCGSELVTNAVLHAGGSLVVRLSMPDGGDVLLEVIDEIPVSDSAVQARTAAGDDARMTGRGLAVLATLAVAWGVHSHDMPGTGEGKVVWARLPVTDGPDGQSSGDGFDDVAIPIRDDVRASSAARSSAEEAVLIDVPVRVFLESEAYFDDVLRELQLAWWARPGDATVARITARLEAFVDRVGQSRATAAALARSRMADGHQRVNLVVRLDSEVVADAQLFLDTMDEVEALGRHDLLLTPPPSAALSAFRRWYVGELTRQRAGDAPLPCPYD